MPTAIQIAKCAGSLTAKFLSVICICIVLAPQASAQIKDTKHNLSSTQTTGNRVSSGTDQICVFCHTPHGSNTNAFVPLWNKAISATTTYTTYNSLGTASLDGEVVGVGSVSLACLSCHDGTQAMDNLLNAPGSGGYNATGASPAGWTWSGANQSSGMLASSAVSNLGTDLRNDHPIGVEYCGGGISGSATTVSGSCTDGDFIGPGTTTTSDGRPATLRTILLNSGVQAFYIDLDGNSKPGKKDILLFPRQFSAGVGPSVECGSCHDPHAKSPDPTNEVHFMRVGTDGSKICLSCHIK